MKKRCSYFTSECFSYFLCGSIVEQLPWVQFLLSPVKGSQEESLVLEKNLCLASWKDTAGQEWNPPLQLWFWCFYSHKGRVLTHAILSVFTFAILCQRAATIFYSWYVWTCPNRNLGFQLCILKLENIWISYSHKMARIPNTQMRVSKSHNNSKGLQK